MRRTFAKTVISFLEQDSSMSVLLGDIGVANFEQAIANYPDRVINVGIMEQGMLGIAAGISRAGGYPVVQTIAPFIVERGYEQLKIDFGYNKQRGLIVTVGASFDYSKLGSTHQCPNDILLVGCIEGFNIYMPGNAAEAEMAIQKSIVEKQLSYIRLSAQEHSMHIEPFTGIKRIKSGTVGTLIVTGAMFSIISNEILNLDIDIFYLNAFVEEIRDLNINPFHPVVILEELTQGSTLFNLKRLGVDVPSSVQSIGIPVEFARNYGTYSEILSDFGMSPGPILEKIKKFLQI